MRSSLSAILFVRPCVVFFFNDTATTEIYTLSLHDALPISRPAARARPRGSSDSCARAQRPRSRRTGRGTSGRRRRRREDRKSTRLNSSHSQISYAVFCLKKKKQLLTRARPPRQTHCKRSTS